MKRAGYPRVTQPFATLYLTEVSLIVRLACVRRAASVHPEPGSNSPFKIKQSKCFVKVKVKTSICSFDR